MIKKILERLSGLKNIFSARWFKFSAVISAAVIVLLGGFLVWANILSPEAREAREYERGIVDVMKKISEIEDRFRADTYGGETPEETLRLFIDALEKDDLELAAKYFKLDDAGYPEPSILEGLKKAEESKELIEWLSKLKQAESVGGWGPYYGFEIKNDDGDLVHSIGLVKNEYSNIWKIQRM